MLDEGDKAIIRTISFEAAGHVAAEVKEHTKLLIEAVEAKADKAVMAAEARASAAALTAASAATAAANAAANAAAFAAANAAANAVQGHAEKCPAKAEIAAIKNRATGGWIVLSVLAAIISVAATLIVAWVRR